LSPRPFASNRQRQNQTPVLAPSRASSLSGTGHRTTQARVKARSC
jgi:hypothetical protein